MIQIAPPWPPCKPNAHPIFFAVSRPGRLPQQVTETACYAMGDDYRRFVIMPTEG
jgi:hypothetical protein